MNLEKFLNDIGRIADALDRLADLKRDGAVALPTAPTPSIDAMPPQTPAEAAPQAEPAKDTPEPQDAAKRGRRAFLKGVLTARGISFPAAARDTTLEKLYAELPVAEEAAVVPPPPAELVTKTDVQTALIAFSAKHSREKAFALMILKGGSNRLSEIPEDRYAALKQALEEGLA
jgi:hypothetical protein